MTQESSPLRHEFESSDYDRLRLQEDGSIIAVDDRDRYVFGITAPWARDANGQSIPTYFEVREESLIQIVQPDRAEKAVKFPIIADPLMGIDLYSSVTITFQPAGFVVNATPSTWGRFGSE